MLTLLKKPGAWSDDRERRFGELHGYEGRQIDYWLTHRPARAYAWSAVGPGRVKKAWYRHGAPDAASVLRRTQMFLDSILRAPLTLPGASVGADLNAQAVGLGCQYLQQARHADDRHYAFHIVGQNVERHFGRDLRQPSHEKCVAPIHAFMVPNGCSAV
jgi:hypothetical protein